MAKPVTVYDGGNPSGNTNGKPIILSTSKGDTRLSIADAERLAADLAKLAGRLKKQQPG